MVTRFESKLCRFTILVCLDFLKFGMTNPVGCTGDGQVLFGSSKTIFERIFYHHNLRRSKAKIFSFKGSEITSCTSSTKIKGVFLSGKGTCFNHVHTYSYETIYETFLRSESSLHCNGFIENNRELLIGTGTGSVYKYNLGKRSLSLQIDGAVFNYSTLFSIF